MNYILAAGRKNSPILDESDFLLKHTKDMINLYLEKRRDLTQTIAELRDNVSLGLNNNTVLSLIDQSMREGDNQQKQRISLLLHAFSNPDS